MTYAGSSRRRIGADRLLRGSGRYVADLPLPDVLHAGFVRSPHAHARILSIDTATARSLPGVVAVHTSADLLEAARPTEPPASPPGLRGKGLYPLASDVVRHVGEPVAVILAHTREAMADAIDAVLVEYEPVDAVVDPEKAIGGGGRVWEDVPDNVAVRVEAGFGDVDDAFRDADIVVEGRFSFARSFGAALEGRVVAAAPGGEGGVRVTMWDSTQAPHIVRRALAQYLGLQEDEIRVVAPDVGGGFGPKGRVYPEEFVLTALALRYGRPVRWVSTRSEDLQTTGHGRGQIHYARMAARSDGTILAIEDRFIQDAGAYTPTGLAISFNTIRHLIGPYRVPALSAQAIGVYTNKALSSALRGGGRPEGVCIVERLLDRLAQRLGIEGAEVRRRNFIKREEFPYRTGLEIGGRPVVYDSGDHGAYLERALEAIGYDEFRRRQEEARAEGKLLGIGLAAFIESSGTGSEGASAEVREDGTIAISVGSPSTGQSHETVFAQLAADRMGVDITSVVVAGGDTAVVDGTGTFASRMTIDGGNAVALAAHELKEKLLDVASHLLEVSPDDLTIENGIIAVKGFGERHVTMAEVAREAGRRGEPLKATAQYEPEQTSAWAGGVNAAIVEVDAATGRVFVLRYVVVHDSGIIVNPAEVEGQIQGGVTHGLGNVLLEGAAYDDAGQLLTSSLADYLIPAFDSVPEVEMVHLESPSPFNPEGVKGAGESGTIGAVPTLMSAIEDALSPFGIAIDAVPIRTEEIALHILRSGAQASSENVEMFPA